MKTESTYQYIILLLAFIILLPSCEDKGEFERLKKEVFIKLFGGVGSEEGNDFIQLDDGGFVIVGSTTSYAEGDKDMFVVRTDENGNEIWSNKYGDELMNIARSVVLSNNNTLIICGETVQENGRRDILVKEVDLSGNELNSLVHGTLEGDESGVDVIRAITDGYLVLGNNIFGSLENPDSSYFYLLEIDQSFQIKPNKDRPLIGDKNNINEAAAVQTYQDQEYLCFGTTKEGGVNAPPGSKNMYFFKIGEIGDATNTQNFYGSTNDELGTAFTKVAGGYLLAGYQINGNRNIPFLVKVNSNLGLEPVWQIMIDEPYDGNVISRTPTSVIETNDGNYMILMNSVVQPFGSEIGLMKISFSGNEILWENAFGSNNNDLTGKIIENDEGGYFMCGSIGFGEENNEIINKMGLFKTNPIGELIPVTN